MYALGVDLGTTFTAAATWRDGHAEIASLGSRAPVIPSVVLLREDSTVLTGETASRRGLSEPHRVAREFKRRLGDTTPILLGGVPYSAEALTARLLRAVVDLVAGHEGGAPDALCISHPANWGPYKTDLLRQAVRLAELDQPIRYTTEPEAAAAFYARQQRIEPGATIAVYDLGGGTFDAAVLRKTDAGFEILGQPEGIERLGGIDVDAAVFGHVSRALGGKLQELDEDDPVAMAAVARLREECVQAKEALSADTDMTIAVLLPNVSTEVRLTRAELEAMVRPALVSTVDALKRALRSAGVSAEQLHSVLLIGGSSRMPVVSQLVGAELGRPVAVDAHPKHAVALGAAWLASSVIPLPDAGKAATISATASLPVTAAIAPDEPSTPAGLGAAGLAAGGLAAGGPGVGGAVDGMGSAPAADAGFGPAADAAEGFGAAPPPFDTGSLDATAPADPAFLSPSSVPPGSLAPTSPAGYADPDPAAPTAPVGYGGSGPTAPLGGPAAATAPVPAGAAAPSDPAYGVERDWRRPLLVGVVVVLALVLAGSGVTYALKGNLFGDGNGGAGTADRQGFGRPGGGGSGGPDGGGPAGGASPDTGGTAPGGTAAPGGGNPLPVDEQCTAAIKANPRWVCLTRATFDGTTLRIEYQANFAGASPNVNGSYHVHIYGGDGTTPPDRIMGTHSQTPGKWYVEDKNPSIRAATSADFRDAVGNAPKVCGRIANALHQLVPDNTGKGTYVTGNCVPIIRS